ESLKNDVAMNKAKAKSGKDNSRQVKVCPIIQQIEPMSESERQIATSTIANIEKVVKDNPNEFGGKDISETSYTGGSKGTGDGTGRETELISVGMPKWIQEIENSVKAKFKRKKKREYFDVEGLVRGVTRKKKEMGMKRIDYVYFMLDVSGSMRWNTFKGHKLLDLFASYIPPMAKRFEGMWVQVDGHKVIPTELSKIGKGEIKSLILGGGGGADFEAAYNFIKNDIAKNGITNPVVVMASDADEQFRFELLPNTIFVTTSKGWDGHAHKNGLIAQGFPNPLKGQKVVIINID
ncbi:MAG TPA: hypothetical protein PLB11_16790, partial [Flavobacterium sp.]|nr:hypothetical protein [Flavobacterium sp.]